MKLQMRTYFDKCAEGQGSLICRIGNFDYWDMQNLFGDEKYPFLHLAYWELYNGQIGILGTPSVREGLVSNTTTQWAVRGHFKNNAIKLFYKIRKEILNFKPSAVIYKEDK